MKTYKILVLFLSLVLISCGSQKRITQAKQKIQIARQSAAAEAKTIDTIDKKTAEKLEKREMDSVIINEYNIVLHKLNEYLKSIESKMDNIELAMQDKSNFRKSAYKQNLAKQMALIDSFNLAIKKRDHIYELINEAVRMKAFNLFDLAAFFGAGKYKIPPGGFEKLAASFLPVIDSIAYLSNKYSNIQHTTRIVFVGYADGMPVGEGSALYNELAEILNQKSPSKQDLNKILSDLRANELLNNTKEVLQNNAAKFTYYNQLKIGYSAYGRGEELPFKTIKDYKEDDERRRIVLFYWCVLPDSSFL